MFCCDIGSFCNEPFGSRPEPGTSLIAFILRPTPGEVPEGKAGVRIQAKGSCARAHSEAAAGNGRYKERLFLEVLSSLFQLRMKVPVCASVLFHSPG